MQAARRGVAAALSRGKTNRKGVRNGEFSSNLDSRTSNEVMELFRELNREGQTVIMVTHNPENYAYADRTIVLRDGKAVAEGGEALREECSSVDATG